MTTTDAATETIDTPITFDMPPFFNVKRNASYPEIDKFLSMRRGDLISFMVDRLTIVTLDKNVLTEKSATYNSTWIFQGQSVTAIVLDWINLDTVRNSPYVQLRVTSRSHKHMFDSKDVFWISVYSIHDSEVKYISRVKTDDVAI